MEKILPGVCKTPTTIVWRADLVVAANGGNEVECICSMASPGLHVSPIYTAATSSEPRTSQA